MKNKIGLCLLATGRYIDFLDQLIDSAKKFFFTEDEVQFILFTDAIDIQRENLTVVAIAHKPWPYVPLHQYHFLHSASEFLKNFDYLYYLDIDSRFVAPVGREILATSMATLHPGNVGSVGTPERDPNSQAYIPHDANNKYFCGAFFGGSSSHFLTMAAKIKQQVDTDNENEIVAVWHDESHLNRFYFDNPPEKILTPSYCYPESWKLDYEKKILALDKDHHAVRGVKKEGKFIKKIKKLLGISSTETWSGKAQNA